MKPDYYRRSKFEQDGVTVYPVPVEEEMATDYELKINGIPVFTHRARVSAVPVNQFLRPYQRPVEQTEIASFANWDMSAPVEVEVVSKRSVKDVKVRPQSAGIMPEVDGDKIAFNIEKCGQYTVEVNGSHHALHLFANPPEKDIPDITSAEVTYFGPGVHCPGIIKLKSGQTVYIDAGAVVYGAILAESIENCKVIGRGILDGSKFDRLSSGLAALVCLHDCSNVIIDGITVRDGGCFVVAPLACDNIHISNIKLIGNWRYNSDGIDFLNCQDCSVEDSFLRTFDDCFCVKGYNKFGSHIYHLRPNKENTLNGIYGHTDFSGVYKSFKDWQEELGIYDCAAKPCHNIQVRRCVFWNDWGKAIEIGIETVAEEFSNIVFEDCDIIHAATAINLSTFDRALCRDIVYRDIRIEFDDDRPGPVIVNDKDQPYEELLNFKHRRWLIKVDVGIGYVTCDDIRGHIDGILFENIKVKTSANPRIKFAGYDADHMVSNVSIKGLSINGKSITDMDSGDFELNGFVKKITIE